MNFESFRLIEPYKFQCGKCNQMCVSTYFPPSWNIEHCCTCNCIYSDCNYHCCQCNTVYLGGCKISSCIKCDKNFSLY